MCIFDKILKNKRKSNFADHIAGEVKIFYFGGVDDVFDCMHSVFADGVVSQIELSKSVSRKNY
jgi:hypothetical protein